MSSDTARAVYSAHRTAQEKYTYFLLAAAGAAIGFAVTRTSDAPLAWSQVPLALAVSEWGLSFFFGCRHLNYVQSTLYANNELLRVQEGRHPLAGTLPQAIAAASEGIRIAVEKNNNRASFFASLQFNML